MTLRFTKYIVFILLLLTNPLLSKDSSLSGKAMYTQNIPLPSKSVFIVVLEDITHIDEPAIVLGETVIENCGQIPISFKINFDDEDVKLGRSYAIRAKIVKDNKLLYVTDTINRVFSGQDDENINLIMKRIYKIPKSHEMNGMYRYIADGAIFRDCVTGKYYPIAFEADNIELEEAYLKKTNGSGESIKIKIEGKVVKRPKMEGSGDEDVLKVTRFISLEGKVNCIETQHNVPISNNYWKLLLLHNKSLEVEDNLKEAHILLRAGIHGIGELKVVSACNIFKGHYEVKDTEINFEIKELANKKICDEKHREEEFLDMLKDASYWEIKGENLNLYNDRDIVLAKFKAIYF